MKSYNKYSSFFFKRSFNLETFMTIQISFQVEILNIFFFQNCSAQLLQSLIFKPYTICKLCKGHSIIIQVQFGFNQILVSQIKVFFIHFLKCSTSSCDDGHLGLP